jgi:ABC-type multidrug transport system ATPase subunit
MTDIAIRTKGLTKRFGDYTAVDALDLEVQDGTVVSLLGPNGAGKTTIVRMLATLIAPDAGHASVGGYDVVRQAAHVRERISLTGQFAALDPHLTARENLVLMAQLRGRRRADAGHRADELLTRFDAEEFRDRLVKNLSGGQRRRIDLAAGLIDLPHVLVLDEPTTGLDPRSRQVVWSTVRELVAEGVTLLLTTQYLEEADAVADQVVLLDRGREVAAGTPAQLKAQVGQQRVDVVAADAETFAEAKIPVDEIALRRPTLDDAFLALTGHDAGDTQDPAPENREPEEAHA